MANWGVHLPNGDLAGDDWQRIRALGVSDYVDLDLFAGRWGWIRQGQPDARIHARCYARGALGDAAAEARAFASVVRAHGQHIATTRWRNESNLEADGATPAQWADWLAAFGQEAGVLGVAAGLFAPAVSPGTSDWLAWLDATVTGARAGGHAGIDGHIYGSPAEVGAVLAEYRKRWDGRLLVTEYNFGAGRQYDLGQWARDLAEVDALARQYNVEAICPFIWTWHGADMSLPTPVDVRGTPVEAALRVVAERSRTVPELGEGFRKARDLITFNEDEIYHFPGQQNETSLAVGPEGCAVWRHQTNRVTVVLNDGRMYVDDGNGRRRIL